MSSVGNLSCCRRGSPVGRSVGYHVRGERVVCESTQVSFVTPGIALSALNQSRRFRFDVVIIDEFHERSMELDLLLALCLRMPKLKLVVMSATIDGTGFQNMWEGFI